MSGDNGGPAFPRPAGKFGGGAAGMTLRDWFAGQALAGLIASDCNAMPRVFAAACYEMADAMLAARKDPKA